VAWVSERKDTLSALFFFLTLIAYARYAQEKKEGRMEKAERISDTNGTNSEIRSPKLWYLFALAFFALGLMSKPMLVTVPFILLLLDYWPLRRFDFHSGVQSSKFNVRSPGRGSASMFVLLLREKLPFLALSAAFATGAVYVGARTLGARDPSLLLPLASMLATLIGVPPARRTMSRSRSSLGSGRNAQRTQARTRHRPESSPSNRAVSAACPLLHIRWRFRGPSGHTNT
jgi:hypothetical protein